MMPDSNRILPGTVCLKALELGMERRIGYRQVRIYLDRDPGALIITPVVLFPVF